MKFVIDERVKHRVVGLVVVLSIAVVFVPIFVKKSTPHFEENMSLSVRLPAKPIAPKVNVASADTLFKTVKVAKVDLPPVDEPRPIQIAKAEPLNVHSVVPTAPVLKNEPVLAKADTVVAPAVRAAIFKKPARPEKLVKPILALDTNKSDKKLSKKEIYAVQLASFTQQENAKLLVSRLRSKGYAATYNKIAGKQGSIYKVIVGQLKEKHEALNLQKQLATSMQLSGFVIKTGVS